MKQYILPIITLSIIATNTIISFEELKDLHQEDAIHEIMLQPGTLHQAIIANNDYLIIRLLNKQHYNVNEKDNYGNTPLHLAIDRKNIVELLLKHGADPNIQNNHGLTALHYAALYNTTPEIVRLLLKHKATNPNIQDNNDSTALHRAILSNKPEIIKLLLEHKATNPNILNSNGLTALHIAILSNKPEIIKLLLEHKAINPNIKDSDGLTALHIAFFRSTPEIVRLLLENNKTNPNIPDRHDNTVLHSALHYNQPEIVKLLLEHGVNSGIKNKKDKTPLNYSNGLQQDLIEQHKIKRNAIIKDSLSSCLPSLLMNLIGEYMGDENPLQKQLLSAINTGNIAEVKVVLSHYVEIPYDIIQAAQDKINDLKKLPAFQSSSDITNACNILKLLESKNPLQQQLLKAISASNLTEVQNALSQGALITTNILKAAQNKSKHLNSPGAAPFPRDMENALQVLMLLKQSIS